MAIIYISLFIIGSLFGSFYCCIANRLSKNESIVTPGSHCENCNHRLTWYELIPIFSFIIQGGKCRKCKIKLSYEYLIVEIVTGLLFALSFIIFEFSYNTLIMIILSSLLVTIFISDFKYMIILDEPLIIGSILILGMKLYFFGFDTFTRSIYSGLIMFIFMLFIKLIGDKAFKRESLGGGDIKLVTFFGFVFGVRLSLASVVFGSFFAFPYAIYLSLSKKDREVPFGPFLIMALLIVFIYMEPIKEFMDLLVYGI
jgi:leader peptidase (prepilin peptidase)/N-methyltransferase